MRAPKPAPGVPTCTAPPWGLTHGQGSLFLRAGGWEWREGSHCPRTLASMPSLGLSSIPPVPVLPVPHRSHFLGTLASVPSCGHPPWLSLCPSMTLPLSPSSRICSLCIWHLLALSVLPVALCLRLSLCLCLQFSLSLPFALLLPHPPSGAPGILPASVRECPFAHLSPCPTSPGTSSSETPLGFPLSTQTSLHPSPLVQAGLI